MGARHSLRKLLNNPSSFQYPKLTPPYERRVRFRMNDNEPVYDTFDSHNSSIIELMNMPFTPVNPKESDSDVLNNSI